jgi:hypothetical protein
MKKTVLLLMAVTLIAWACKKDKEPEPTPVPTPYQITSTDIASVNEEYRVAIYTLLPADTFTAGTAGQSKTWVYNPIPLTYDVDTSKFEPLSNHPDGAFYTTANMFLKAENNVYMFLNKQSDRVDLVGVWVVINDDTLKGILSNPYTVMKFPITYGASFIDSGLVVINSTMEYQGQNLPAKYEMFFKVNANCNAEGNVTTPIGSFKCIREKRLEINSFKASVQVLTQWMEVYSQSDTTYSYSFWSKDKKWNVAEVKTDATDKVISVGYLTE